MKSLTDSNAEPATKILGDKMMVRIQEKYRDRLEKFVDFQRQHDGRYLTAWECNFIDALNLERNNMPKTFHITERQRSTMDAIYSKISDKM